MARIYTPPSQGLSTAVTNEQVQALMDDLENSIASFDDRFCLLTAETPPPAPRSDTQAPCPVPDPLPAPAVKEAAVLVPAQPASPAPAGDLLGQLAQAAAAQTQTQTDESYSQRLLARRLNDALRRSYDYFHQFTQHLNVLKPAVSLNYALDARHRFADPHWSEGVANYRTNGRSEEVLLESVVLRLRFSAAAVEVMIAEEKITAFRNELQILNLEISEETNVGRTGKAGTRFKLAGSIPVQLNFRADMLAEHIAVRARNIGGLGLSAYALDPDAMTHTTFDAIGLCLLGRATHMPESLKPVTFRMKETP